MPLYHAAAGINSSLLNLITKGCIGVSVTWFGGFTMVLRRKFSARNFFQDCALYKVTIIQYIGEICRYLVATPPSEFDHSHCVKKAVGNGLSPAVWRQFQNRFQIPYIGEFYGATEGNANLINIFSQVFFFNFMFFHLVWCHGLSVAFDANHLPSIYFC